VIHEVGVGTQRRRELPGLMVEWGVDAEVEEGGRGFWSERGAR
jgi:hypothetical protein